uniref:Uncharacterized protein n=1 Tax=Panagrolaimus sp. ES5 TaxID=591445 RepID=A0AC34F3Z8_9BILA
MTQHKSTSKFISRRHKWLRYLLRRRPCFYISLCQAATFIVLSIVSFLCIWFYLETRGIRKQYDAEDAHLETLSNFKTFAHCFYKPLKNPNFHVQSCGENSRNHSFAWRHHELQHQNEPTCLDRHEQINCHEYISNVTINIEFAKNYTACAGVGNISMDSVENRFLSSRPSIIVKQPRIQELSPHLWKTLHSSELFVRCPKCKKITVPFKDKEKCQVKLFTTQYGWPSSKMYECDNFLQVPSSKCLDADF